MSTTTTYFATEAKIKELTAITENVDKKSIAPYMLFVQQRQMESLLGRQLCEQILSEIETSITVLGATATNPVVVTTDGNHDYTTGDSVNIQGAKGMLDLNGQFTVTVLSTTTFELDGLDGSAFPAYLLGTATVVAMRATNVTLMEYIVLCYSWWVFRSAVPFLHVHTINSALQSQGIASGNGRAGSEGATLATPTQARQYLTEVELIAQGYSDRMLSFLKRNRADYPLWNPSCTSVPSNDSTGGENPYRKKFFAV